MRSAWFTLSRTGWAASVALGFALAGGALAAHPPFADRLPGDTLVYVGAERPVELAGKLLERVRPEEGNGLAGIRDTLGELLEARFGIGMLEILPLAEANAAIAVFPAGSPGEGRRNHSVLLVDTGPAGRVLPGMIDQARLRSGEDSRERVEETHFGARIVGFVPRDREDEEPAGDGIHFAHFGDTFVAGDSPAAVRLALNRAEAPPSPSLAESPAFVSARARLGEGESVLAFVNVQRIAAELRRRGEAERRQVEAYGLGAARSFAATLGLDGPEVTLRLLVETSEAPSGLLAAVTPSLGGLMDPALIPPDAVEFWSVGLRPVEMWRGLIGAMRAANPLAGYWLHQATQQATEALGEPFDFERDVLGAVGENASGYRPSGPASAPVVFAGLASRHAFDSLWAKATMVAPRLASGVRTETYLGHRVTVMGAPASAGPAALGSAPAFCVLGNRLAYSPRLEDLQRYLRFANADGRSLATRRSFRRALAALPPGQWGALYFAESTGPATEGLGLLEAPFRGRAEALSETLLGALAEAMESLGAGGLSAGDAVSRIAPVRAVCAVAIENGMLVVAKGLPSEAAGN